MTKLLLIPLDDTVVFPTMDVTLPVDVGDAEQVLLVPRHEGEYASVGTIARVAEKVRLPGGAHGASLEGVARGIAGAAETDHRGRLRVEVEERDDDVPVDGSTRTSSASTAPPSRRSSSCAATTGASPPGCARSPSPARWPTPPATRPT